MSKKPKAGMAPPTESDRDPKDLTQTILPPESEEDQVEELLGALRSASPEEAKILVRSITSSQSWSGPLPPPQALKEYSDAIPDGGDRIVANWETESNHRRGLQSRGQWLAVGIAMAAIVASVVCALNGQPWVGGTIILAAMIAIGLTGAVNLFRRDRK